MKTTKLNELLEYLTNALGENELYSTTEIVIHMNDKKLDHGTGSISIMLKTQEGKRLAVSIYIIEREKFTITVFVNDNTHDIVFNNMSPDSVEKAKKYIIQYIERSTKKLLGIEINDGSKPKKSNNKESKKDKDTEKNKTE